MVRLTTVVDALPDTVPFVGPEAHERNSGRVFKARIGANENVFGPSPRAIAAMQDAVPGAWRYGDPESHDLRKALAKHYQVGMENIVVGEGIDGLLGYLCRMVIEPGVRVVSSKGAYPTFNFHVHGNGGKMELVPFVNDHESPEGLVQRANATDARLVYLANPDNPMGTWNSAEAILAALDRLRSACLMVLDEAYIECAPAGASPPIDINDRRMIRMRTFSKIYGMAGMRVGYAIGHADMIGTFNRVRNHFGMCRVSQAGALAALADRDYMADTIDRIASARRRIAGIARAAGLETLPSGSNFVAVDCGRNGDYARAVMDRLLARDIFVRMPFVAPQDRCIRVSAGRAGDLDLLEKCLPAALEEARSTLPHPG